VKELGGLSEILLCFIPFESDNAFQRRVKHRRGMHLLNLLSLRVHIRLAQSERVDVRPGVQVRQAVVHEAVRGLVGADRVDKVEHRCIGREAPVVNADLWSRFARPLREESILDVLDAPCAIGRLVLWTVPERTT